MIQEALDIFKTWNPGYEPRYSMADCDMAEVIAIVTLLHPLLPPPQTSLSRRTTKLLPQEIISSRPTSPHLEGSESLFSQQTSSSTQSTLPPSTPSSLTAPLKSPLLNSPSAGSSVLKWVVTQTSPFSTLFWRINTTRHTLQ